MNMSTHIGSRWPAAAQWIVKALAGAAAGVALGAATGFAGARALAGSASGFGDLVAAILGAMIGYTVGTAIGVYLAGRLLGRRGSFWPALAGSLLGAALALLAAGLLRLNTNTALLQAVFAIVPPIGATLALNVRLPMGPRGPRNNS